MWENAKGETIKISDMSDSYLLNAINFVQKKAKDGMVVKYGSSGVDMDDMWYDEETLYGKEVFEQFEGYYDLVDESKRRKLVIRNSDTKK